MGQESRVEVYAEQTRQYEAETYFDLVKLRLFTVALSISQCLLDYFALSSNKIEFWKRAGAQIHS